MLLSSLLAATNSPFGEVSPPPGVDLFNKQAAAGGADGIGLLIFMSNLIKIATVVAGVWVLFNFISAGYMYITSAGESNVANKVKDQITMSIMGLIFIVGAYTVIALLSFFLFGNPGYILNPTIEGPKP